MPYLQGGKYSPVQVTEMEKMKIGFTGSSKVVTLVQEISLKELLLRWKLQSQVPPGFKLKAHHGDCIVADAIFHEICLTLNIPLIGHPPIDEKKRAFCQGFSEIWEPKEYLERNKDIVNEIDILIVAPDSYEEKLRSGTWSTYRYAKKLHQKIYVIYPNGVVKPEKYEE